jgi:hypothetical protein
MNYNGPPNLTSGTFPIQKTASGQYQAISPIPIGAMAALISSSPGPAITSYTWSGGTYTGYVGGFATNAAPPSQASPTTPLATGQSYGFIVSQPNQAYSVELTVTYQGGGMGTATVTFNSVAPMGKLAVDTAGTQTWSVTGALATVNLSPPIVISATATVGQYTAGQFMFLQIVDSTIRSYISNTGQSWYTANTPAFPGFGGPLIDSDSTIGYSYVYNSKVGFSWSLPTNGNNSLPGSAPFMTDGPGASTDIDYSQVGAMDAFSTYLMYEPNIQGSVWIALSEVDWSWSDTATNAGGTWTGSTVPQPTPAGPSQPTGIAAFPPWVNTTSAFKQVPYQKGP